MRRASSESKSLRKKIAKREKRREIQFKSDFGVINFNRMLSADRSQSLAYD